MSPRTRIVLLGTLLILSVGSVLLNLAGVVSVVTTEWFTAIFLLVGVIDRLNRRGGPTQPA